MIKPMKSESIDLFIRSSMRNNNEQPPGFLVYLTIDR